MPPDLLTKLLGEIGPYGFIAFLLWYTLQRHVPKVVSEFTVQLREERSKIDDLRRGWTSHVGRIMEALQEQTAVLRYMLAKMTSVQIANQTMEELICPHDGLPCQDHARRLRYKEERDRGGLRPGTNEEATLDPQK